MKNILNNLHLNSLLHFHSIAKHRSLRLAAKELNLSAPAITHSLNKLEADIGETLCIRTRTSFSLTSIGLNLYQTTQKIFQELENFSIDQEIPSEFKGALNIGILDHFDNPTMESAIRKTVQKFPNLKLNIQAFDSEEMNSLLLNKEIDLAFGIFGSYSPRIKYTKIGEENLRFFISKHHSLWKKTRLTKEDLIGEKVTWLDNHSRKNSDLELNIFVENPKYKMKFYGFSNNLSGAVQILLSGHTIVPLPCQYGRSLMKNYQIRELNIDTRIPKLDQMLAINPIANMPAPAKMLIESMGIKMQI